MRIPSRFSAWQIFLTIGLSLNACLFIFTDASRVVRVLALAGAIVLIFARDTKAGLSSRGAFLTTPSPELAWRVLGAVLWLIAALVFVLE